MEIPNHPFTRFFSITSSHFLPRVSQCTCWVGNGIKAEVISAASSPWSVSLDGGGNKELLFFFFFQFLNKIPFLSFVSLCPWYCRLLTVFLPLLSPISLPIYLHQFLFSPSSFIHPPPSSSLVLSPGAVSCRSGTSRLTCSGR